MIVFGRVSFGTAAQEVTHPPGFPSASRPLLVEEHDMRTRNLGLVISVAMLAIWASHPVLAQERFGSLSGIVTDASKAAVPGATVTATNAQTGATRIAISGAEGTYRLPDLEPGRYGVTIELQGFQKA